MGAVRGARRPDRRAACGGRPRRARLDRPAAHGPPRRLAGERPGGGDRAGGQRGQPDQGARRRRLGTARRRGHQRRARCVLGRAADGRAARALRHGPGRAARVPDGRARDPLAQARRTTSGSSPTRRPTTTRTTAPISTRSWRRLAGDPRRAAGGQRDRPRRLLGRDGSATAAERGRGTGVRSPRCRPMGGPPSSCSTRPSPMRRSGRPTWHSSGPAGSRSRRPSSTITPPTGRSPGSPRPIDGPGRSTRVDSKAPRPGLMLEIGPVRRPSPFDANRWHTGVTGGPER